MSTGREVSARPGVGVGVLVGRAGTILLVRRRHHGAGQWATPGGYLDLGEDFETCAVRETREETGLAIARPLVVGVANDRHPDGKHNVTVWLVATVDVGDAAVASDELDAVGWFGWNDLPTPLYLSTSTFFEGRTHPPDAWRTARALLEHSTG